MKLIPVLLARDSVQTEQERQTYILIQTFSYFYKRIKECFVYRDAIILVSDPFFAKINMSCASNIIDISKINVQINMTVQLQGSNICNFIVIQYKTNSRPLFICFEYGTADNSQSTLNIVPSLFTTFLSFCSRVARGSCLSNCPSLCHIPTLLIKYFLALEIL